MSTIDWIIVALLVGSLLMGFKRGVIRQVVQLVSFFVAFFLAYNYFRQAVPFLKSWIPFPKLGENFYWSMLQATVPVEEMFYNALAFGVIFFGARLLLKIAGHFLDGIASLPVLSFFNRWLGAMLSLVEVILIIILLVNIAAAIPNEKVQYTLEDSPISQYILQHSPVLTEQLQDLWQEHFNHKEDQDQEPVTPQQEV